MTNIANMNATLTLSAWEFNAGLKQSDEAAREFSRSIDESGKRVNSGMKARESAVKGLAGVAQQAGYAFQDFASQIETRGLSGALGAVSNNIQAAGSALGPLPAAIFAVSGALAGTLLPKVIEWIDGSKKVADANRAIKESFEALKSTLEGVSVSAGVSSAKDAVKTIENLTAQRTALAKESGIIQRIIREEMAEAFPDQGKIGAWRQRLVEVGNEYDRIEMKLKVVNEEWTPGRIRRGLSASKADEDRRAELKRAEEERLKAYDKENEFKNERRKAENELIMKSLSDYGTESQKLEQRLSDERTRLRMLEVDKEALARFDAMAAVERERLKISEAERALSDLGQAAGMSAGANRASAAGVTAMNRAIVGTATEQAVAKEALAVAKQSLKELEQIARNGGNPPKVFQMAGG